MVPSGTIACQRARASPLGHWTTFFFFYTQRVRNLAFVIHKPTKNMASISVRVGICAVLFLAIMNRLPPTPLWHSLAVPCNKAEFRVLRRHAVGGVCEQRMTALRKYIYRYGYKHEAIQNLKSEHNIGGLWFQNICIWSRTGSLLCDDDELARYWAYSTALTSLGYRSSLQLKKVHRPKRSVTQWS